jgi:hypothetical protein
MAAVLVPDRSATSPMRSAIPDITHLQAHVKVKPAGLHAALYEWSNDQPPMVDALFDMSVLVTVAQRRPIPGSASPIPRFLWTVDNHRTCHYSCH